MLSFFVCLCLSFLCRKGQCKHNVYICKIPRHKHTRNKLMIMIITAIAQNNNKKKNLYKIWIVGDLLLLLFFLSKYLFVCCASVRVYFVITNGLKCCCLMWENLYQVIHCCVFLLISSTYSFSHITQAKMQKYIHRAHI